MTTACAPPSLCFPDTALNCPNSSKIYKVRFTLSQFTVRQADILLRRQIFDIFRGRVGFRPSPNRWATCAGKPLTATSSRLRDGKRGRGQKKKKTGSSDISEGRAHSSQAHSLFLMRRQQRASDYNNCLLLGVEHLLSRRAGQWAGIIRGLYRYR